MQTKRLDNLLVERGMVPSRSKAQARIMAHQVLVDGTLVTKSGSRVPVDATIVLKGAEIPYVSRGGLKLEKAISAFNIDFQNKIVLDVGASTGGFTDCALQNGAAMVYAVDVGYGQLAWKLRQDGRVRILERTNIRYLDKSRLSPPPSIACIDVSFISLRSVLGPVVDLLDGEKEIMALVKPQFEVGKGLVGKGGIVRHLGLHKEVLTHITLLAQRYFSSVRLDYSPIKGNKGNIEYLLYANNTDVQCPICIDQLISVAQQQLQQRQV